jgi:phosphatidylserine/phosphatidylglycerophosphate/cardiolipin synthase-like enzyme
MLESSQTVSIYVQTVTDDSILDILSRRHTDKKNLFICTANNEDNRRKQEKYSFEWKFAKKPYLHAKVIIFDDAYILITSNNLTRNSLDNNREV